MRFLLPLVLLANSLLAVDTASRGETVFLNFEGDGFDDWTLEGPAFGVGPCVELPEKLVGVVRGFSDESFGCSAHGGLAAKGSLTSPGIAIGHPFLSFSIGGASEDAGLELIVDGKVVQSASGRGDFTLRRVTWNVAEFQGREATIRIFDDSEEGAILIDQILAHPRGNTIPRPPTREGKIYEPGMISSPALPGAAIPEGTTLGVFADFEEHEVYSPTALTIAEDGRLFVAETHRFRHGIQDNRDHLYWVMDDIAAQTTDDRRKLHEKWQAEVSLDFLTEKSEKVRMLMDTDGDGRADHSQVFADGFNDLLDGTAAGVFAFEGVVYFSCIPTIWALQDGDGDGVAEDRISLQDGFGTRISLSGHDMNGFALGPDGRIYGSIGDRSLNITTAEGLHYELLDQGAAFRFEPDGSNFEIFHTGLRNPKEIAFNEVGDAFSVDNNADMGDRARVVYLVDGADSGWRTNHQNMHTFHREIGMVERPPNLWMAERMWDLANEEQPAWLLPPLAHLSNGPSGLAYQPGTALGGDFADRFFICDYKGGPSASGIYSFGLEPVGASYAMVDDRKFMWGVGVTDIDFGFDGKAYISDFVTGWSSADQGRILALQSNTPHPRAEEVAALVKEGFSQREPEELAKLLSHPDQRVRIRAQLALVQKPRALAHFYSQLHLRDELLDMPVENLLLPPLDFDDELRFDNTPLARLHATWGIAMIARQQKDPYATAALVGLLKSSDAELRAQAAKALGEAPVKNATALIEALKDSSQRVRFFAALSLGRLGVAEAFQPLLSLAIAAGDLDDPYLRHAVAVGLSGCAPASELQTLSGHALPSVRLAALLALRRLGHSGVNRFLFDHTPAIRHDAIRIIHDTPIESARLALPDVVDELLAKKDPTVPPMIWRRLTHSLFRLATPANAKRLFQIASAEHLPLGERQEALRLLEQWTEPHPVDQSLGRYAPLRPRPSGDIRPLIESELAPLLAPESGLIAPAVALISRYGVAPKNIEATQLLALVESRAIAPTGRAQVLRLLSESPDFALSPLLVKLLEDPEEPSELRLEALALLTATQPAVSFPFVSQGLTSSDQAYRQGSARLLAQHPHSEVPLLLVAYLDRLREGKKAERTIELEMLEAARASKDPSVAEALAAVHTTRAHDPLASHLESLWGGDAQQGRELFQTHPASQCARCHLADHKQSADGMAGPHLAGIGQKNRRYLLESLIKPSAVIASGFAPVSARLTNGETLSGTILERTEDHLDLLVNGEALRLMTSDIASTTAPVSPMPAMGALLQAHEIRDIVAYLGNLKKPQQSKKPLAPEPKRYHPSSATEIPAMAEETTPTQDPTADAPATPAAAGIPEGVDPAFWELGKKQYDTPGSCTTCHQPTGLGLTGAFPPLAESEWVTGPVENLIRIQLQGLQGDITVKGQKYSSVMPAMAQQTDEQIAAVLTYVRNSFGNSASAVTPEMVATLRAKAGTEMLTVADLIDPATVKEAAPPKGPVTGDLPKVESSINVPLPLFTFPFIVVVLLVSAKFLLGGKKA